jgi:hypothetical protein
MLQINRKLIGLNPGDERYFGLLRTDLIEKSIREVLPNTKHNDEPVNHQRSK